MSATGLTDTMLTAEKLADITECRRRFGLTFPTFRGQTKISVVEGCSRQTHLPTLPAKLMYADQTGLFPAVSSLDNKYVMILHHVHSNSSWLETIQNQLGGKLMLARAQALGRMQCQGLIPKHQKSLTIKHQQSTRRPFGPPA